MKRISRNDYVAGGRPPLVIVVHTTIPFDPATETHRDRLLDDLVARAREESGTVTYRVSHAREDEHTVRFFEVYEDRAAHETHTDSEAYRAFVTALPDLTAGEIETTQCATDDLARVSFTGREAAESVEE